MRNLRVGRLLRMRRIRRGQRQSDVARAAGLSSSVVGRHEAGEIARMDPLRAHAEALGLRAEVRLTGIGGELARLSDDEHAAIQELLAARLRARRFEVVAELSFNEWGERGRVDLAAFEAGSAMLVVVEVKAELSDLQDTLGRLDVKGRLAKRIASLRGWQPAGAAVVLAVAATSANRAIVAAHPALFSGYTRRWLRDAGLPSLVPGKRMLLWVPARQAGRSSWLAGRHRVSGRRGRS